MVKGKCMFNVRWGAAKSLQSCPTLCNPKDGSPPGSPVPGILQVRTLEWVAISFSKAWKWNVKVKSLSRVWLFETPWTAAYQAPLSMGFSRQEYWSGVPLPSPRWGGVRQKLLFPSLPVRLGWGLRISMSACRWDGHQVLEVGDWVSSPVLLEVDVLPTGRSTNNQNHKMRFCHDVKKKPFPALSHSAPPDASWADHSGDITLDFVLPSWNCSCLVTKLCLTLSWPHDCSPLGSSVRGISQARILVHVSRSVLSNSSTSWTVAHQTPLFMGFSVKNMGSGFPFPSPGDLPDPGIKLRSPALQADFLPSEHQAISFSRGSSRPRDGILVFIGRWILYCWTTREAQNCNRIIKASHFGGLPGFQTLLLLA